MANIATNTYLFYGDKDELEKAHAEIMDLFKTCRSNLSCVPVDAHPDELNGEWIDDVSVLTDADIKFEMVTNSRWYGNPLYWNNWVKEKYPKLSVAFSCEEPGLEIFERVDPDHMFDESVFLCSMAIDEEEIPSLPYCIKDCINKDTFNNDYYVSGVFLKEELTSTGFDYTKLSEKWYYHEFVYTTYEDIENANIQLNIQI